MKQALSSVWQSIIQPPYTGVPWLVWTYVVLSCLMLSDGGVFTGHLLGFDDHVRMVQVLNWVNGAGWYDRTIMRANPPEGFTTIWSRIVDIPIAAVVIVAQQFVSQRVAALIASALVPLVELAILFAAAPYFARPLVGKQKARLIVLFLVFTSILNAKYFSASGFLLGEASHHAWYVILDLTMFGAAARLAMGSACRAPILMLGGSIALLIAVGIESFPMMAGVTAILALAAWGFNRPLLAARGAAGILCGAVGSFLLLPLHQPPANFFTVSFVEPSIFGVILVALAGLFLALEYAVLRRLSRQKLFSAFLLCLIAAVMGYGLITAFPPILNGPGAGLSPAERKMAFSEHYEALPVHVVAQSLMAVIYLLMPVVMALAAGIYATIKSKGRRRAVAFCYLGFATLGGGLCELYSRYYHHAMTTACAWLLWIWETLKKRLKKNTSYGLKSFFIFIAVGPFWLLLLPALMGNAPFTAEVVFFPADMQVKAMPCDPLPMANYINEHYGKETLLIVPYWKSAEFLYYTDVRIDFLANYPSHDKFIDNYDFFKARDPREAQIIAIRHGIDLVATCQSPMLYNPFLPANRQIFDALLQTGQVPPWLKLVSTRGLANNYLLYEVDKEEIKKGLP